MKTIQFIGGLLVVFAFFWVLGSVGSCDCENITLGQCTAQSSVGLVGAGAGLLLLKISGGLED